MKSDSRERRGHNRQTTRSFTRVTARFTAVILAGAIIARLVMMTIDLIAARNGPPGGEITLPIYAVLLPALGWYLRGTWDKATGTAPKFKTRKEQLQ